MKNYSAIKKEWAVDTHNMGESQTNHDEQKRSDKKEHMIPFI